MIQEYPSYAVAIRTLGTANEKYQKLLDSISQLQPKPEEVIVVLPEGYSKPDYFLGYEKIVFSPKGMIIQRLRALDYISSEFVLFCDDDIEFDSNFVAKLFEPLCHNDYSCAAGPLLDFFPPKSIKYLLASALGGACVMLRNRDKQYVRILRTGGWSYNRDINTDKSLIYETDSLPWTCFFIKTDVMKRIAFEDEIWIEKNGYAAFEDRVMFYKLKRNGFKTCIVSNALYKHNDAKTSTKELKLEPMYARAFNHYVFWDRYINSFSNGVINKLWCRICIEYYIFMQILYHELLVMVKREKAQVRDIVKKGFSDAKDYCGSDEYISLNPVITLKRL